MKEEMTASKTQSRTAPLVTTSRTHCKNMATEQTQVNCYGINKAMLATAAIMKTAPDRLECMK